jgi:hypothetical protein
LIAIGVIGSGKTYAFKADLPKIKIRMGCHYDTN